MISTFVVFGHARRQYGHPTFRTMIRLPAVWNRRPNQQQPQQSMTTSNTFHSSCISVVSKDNFRWKRNELRLGTIDTICHRNMVTTATRTMSTSVNETEAAPSVAAPGTKQQYLYMWGTDQHGTLLKPPDLDIATTKTLDVPTMIPNWYQQLSTTLPSTVTDHTTTATTALLSPKISKLICGPTDTAILLDNGLCFVSGENKYGQLGVVGATPSSSSSSQNTSTKHQPILVPTLVNPYIDTLPDSTDSTSGAYCTIRDVALGTNFAAFIVETTDDAATGSATRKGGGDLYTVGFGGSTLNGVGCLGHGDVQSRLVPTLVESLVEDNCFVSQVVAGDAHCTILTTEHEILTTGSGSYGRLGNFDTVDQLYFEPVEIFPSSTPSSNGGMASGDQQQRIVQIAGGKSFTLALSSEGIIYGWGRNHKGQLGVGLGLATDMYAMQAVPEPIDTSELINRKIIKIAAGHSHAACISESGEVFHWGMSLHLEPVLVDSLLHTKIVDIVCGQDYTLAIDMNGHMYSLGSGSKTGVLGQGSKVRQLNQAALMDTFRTGDVVVNGSESTDATKTKKVRRKIIHASAGSKHAACILEEEPIGHDYSMLL
jgi:alpha-tubulin suppressor-like RCC1 family protein